MAGKRLKGGLLLTGANAATALCSFLRNVIIARLISVEDFGIAATFALTVAMIEMCSNIAIDRMLVQAPDGDDENLQATAHGIQIIQGVFGGAVLFAIAAPVATVFDIPEVTWAFQLLALVPVIRGISHLDRARFQRNMSFGPVSLVEVGSQIPATLVAFPAGYFCGDYRAMLWVVLTQFVLYAFISHAVAKRRYRVAFVGPLARRALSFGGPLLLNGFLMFGIFQGDRAIVGIWFSMSEMGWFSAAFALTMAPTMMVSRVFQSFFLPELARAQDDTEKFNNIGIVVLQLSLLGGLIVALGFAIAGPAFLELFYGEQYLAGASVIGILGAMQGIRLMRVGPTIISIAKAQTVAPLIANIARTTGLAISIGALMLGHGVIGIAIGSLIGEILAIATALYLIVSRLSVPISGFLITSAAAVAFGLATVLGYDLIFTNHSVWRDIGLGTLITGLAAVCLLGSMRHTIRWLRRHDF